MCVCFMFALNVDFKSIFSKELNSYLKASEKKDGGSNKKYHWKICFLNPYKYIRNWSLIVFRFSQDKSL